MCHKITACFSFFSFLFPFIVPLLCRIILYFAAVFEASVEIPWRARGNWSGGDFLLRIFWFWFAVWGVSRADSRGAHVPADSRAASGAACASSTEHQRSQVVSHAARYVNQRGTEAEGLLKQIFCWCCFVFWRNKVRLWEKVYCSISPAEQFSLISTSPWSESSLESVISRLASPM